MYGYSPDAKAILLWDIFKAHLEQSAKHLLAEHNIIVIMIHHPRVLH